MAAEVQPAGVSTALLHRVAKSLEHGGIRLPWLVPRPVQTAAEARPSPREVGRVATLQVRKYMSSTLQIHVKYIASTCQVHCKCMSSSLQVHFKYIASTCQVHCKYIASTWKYMQARVAANQGGLEADFSKEPARTGPKVTTSPGV